MCTSGRLPTCPAGWLPWLLAHGGRCARDGHCVCSLPGFCTASQPHMTSAPPLLQAYVDVVSWPMCTEAQYIRDRSGAHEACLAHLYASSTYGCVACGYMGFAHSRQRSTQAPFCSSMAVRSRNSAHREANTCHVSSLQAPQDSCGCLQGCSIPSSGSSRSFGDMLAAQSQGDCLAAQLRVCLHAVVCVCCAPHPTMC
jgi:hypothetical protein